MKVALVHEWLTNLAGSERVLLALARLFPEAPIYTAAYRPRAMGPEFAGRDIRPTFLDRLPVPHQAMLPLLPLAFESLDLREYDLVLTSSHACAKGVLTRADALHVAYCHTPMRYAWDMAHDYQAALPPLARPLSALLLSRLRVWDLAAASRVDRFVANSRAVAQRIAKWYRRPATVIHPPVQLSRFCPSPRPGERFLLLGRLVGYKQPELAIAAFERLGWPLDVVGDGPLLRRLRAEAGPTVRFHGRLPDADVNRLLADAQAVVFPALEDFGLVPLEAMAAGRPVVALRGGGALDTVLPGVTGVFFDRPTPDALAEAVRAASRMDWDPTAIRAHAAAFDEPAFHDRMRAFVARALALHAAGERELAIPAAELAGVG